MVTEASSLHNICEELYLADLAPADAVGLIADGLQVLGVTAETSEQIGDAVYARVAGHPYLTQRIGALLERAYHRGVALDVEQVSSAARQIARGDVLVRRIWTDLREHQLGAAARRLLTDPPRFTRLDDELVRLELIGLAKPAGDHWAARNPLLAEVFSELLGIVAPAPEPAPAAPPREPRADQTALPQPTADEIKHQQDLLAINRKRLRVLEQQATTLGSYVPPHVIVGIDETRACIAQIKAVLRDWEVMVEDAADDEAPGVSEAPPQPAPAPYQQDQSSASGRDAPKWINLNPTLFKAVGAIVVVTIVMIAIWRGRAEQQSTASPSLPPWVPELVHVPAGPFLMGSSDVDTQAVADERPQYQLNLPDFWIGKTEVTNAQFRPFVEGDGYTNPSYWTTAGWAWRQENGITHPEYWYDPQWNADTLPVVGISWFEAVAYCRWLAAQTGLPFRLPSEAEWEKAARGPDGRIWPWGNTWEAGRSNSSEANIGQTTPVSQYPQGASQYGALDMAGNVWEWCATRWQKRYPYQLEDEWQATYLEPDAAGRVLRGGSWNSKQQHVRGAYRGIYAPRVRNNTSGLRVVSQAPRPDSES